MAEHIKIGDISPRIPHTGNGTEKVFTYLFPIFTDADMEVYEDATLKTITTHYTVAGAGDSSGGTVTFVTAPALDVVVTLRRNITIKRTSDFQEAGEFRAKVINDELDKLTATQQQIETDQDRSLRLGPTDSATSTFIPAKAARKGKVMGFDAVTGDPVVSTESLSAIEGASTSAAAAAVSAGLTAADVIAADAAATAAATSASVAATAAASNLFSKVVNKATADSPYTVLANTDDGTLFTVADDGAVSFTLPSITAALEGERYGFLRVGASFAVTLLRNGTDTINGVAGNYTVTALAGEILLIVADQATSDNWIVIPWTQATAGTGLTKTGSTISLAGGVVIDSNGNLSGHGTTITTDATTARILSAADNGKIIRMTNAAANTVTLPQTTTAALPAGFQCTVIQASAGATTITFEGTDTINGAPTAITHAAQYDGVLVYKVTAGSPNAYEAVGAFV